MKKDVFAVGDVALRRDQLMAIESVHNAQETAAVAAAAVTGSIAPTIQTLVLVRSIRRKIAISWRGPD